MNKTEQRKIAIGAARSYLRKQGIYARWASADSAFAALDDLARLDTDLVASRWYMAMSKTQAYLFKRGWRKWQKGKRDLLARLDITDQDVVDVLEKHGIQATLENVEAVSRYLCGIARAWASAALQDVTREQLEDWLDSD